MGTPAKSFNLPSYVLSRFAFLGTHAVFAYWLNFLLNDPLNLGGNTLDVRKVKPTGECTPYIRENIIFDLGLFGLWSLSHSGLARQAYKKAVGLVDHPLERPLFAAIATIVWGINVIFWKPITDCERWDPLEVPLTTWAISGTLMALAIVLLVGFLWVLPDHVFGTARYQYRQGQIPRGSIIWGFPYGIVRHPAATAFLWAYWSLPAQTVNHIFLASLWTVYILFGTLVFEEGGLKGNSEFGKEYAAYRSQVPAFYPRLQGLKELFGISKPKSTNRKPPIRVAVSADKSS